MRTKLFARVLTVLLIFAASCQSDMPSIKRSELIILALMLGLGLVSVKFQKTSSPRSQFRQP